MPTRTAIPKLRADLEPFAILEDGRTIVVLGDPVSGRYFRLKAVEGTILALLDGRHDLESIHDEVGRAFPGRAPSLEAVERFIAQAGQMGFLEGVVAEEPPRSFLSRLLFIKVPFGNPDRWLTQLHDRLAFLYHPVSQFIAILLVLAAAVVAATSLDDLKRSMVLPRSGGELALMWLSVSFITLIHELGHGLTCRHFGARSSGFGLLFIYFLPCFYCDVSGAWTLARRSHRLWVGAAGLVFQFVAGAVALLLWRVLEPTSLPAQICLAMVSVCGLDALVNLVPLIRLDGYYLLSDWLQIPNLRPRALGHVGGRLREWLLGIPGARLATTPRQERILLLYGSAAGIFAAGMFLWGISRLYGWFYGRFGGAGALAVGAFTLLLVGGPAWRLVALWGGGVRTAFWALVHSLFVALRLRRESTDHEAATPRQPGLPPRPPRERRGGIRKWWRGESQAESRDGLPPRPTPEASRRDRAESASRASRPSLRPLGLLGVLAAGIAALVWGTGELNVVGACRLEAMQSVPVRAARDGILSELRYREGDWVPPGAVIGSLDTFELQKEIASLESRMGMLGVEIEMARGRVPLVAAERAGETADAAAALPRARVQLAEVSDVQRYRVAEAKDRADEAWALVLTAARKAARLRADVDRIARGDYPPALLALFERMEKFKVEARHAEREVARRTSLVSQGALASREADDAQVRHAGLRQEELAAASELLAAERKLRNDAEDAVAEVDRARLAYRAVQATYHQVLRQAAPSRVAAAREEIGARQQVVRQARARERETDVRLSEVRLKRLDRERLSTQVATARRRVSQSQLIARAGGVVATRRLDQKLGQRFHAGEAVCLLDLTGALQVRVFVDERDVAEIETRAPTRFKVAAFPDRVFDGTVARIVRRSLPANGRNSYEVRLRVENPEGRLMPGMTGWAKIGCGRRSWGTLLGRRLTRYLRTEAWSWL